MTIRMYAGFFLPIALSFSATCAESHAISEAQKFEIFDITRMVVHPETQDVMLIQKGTESLTRLHFDGKKYQEKLLYFPWKDHLSKVKISDYHWEKNATILAVNQDHTLAVGYKYVPKDGACVLYSYKIVGDQLQWAGFNLDIPFTDPEMEKNFRPSAMEFIAGSPFLTYSNHWHQTTVVKIDKEGVWSKNYQIMEGRGSRDMTKVVLGTLSIPNYAEGEDDRLYVWSGIGRELQILESVHKKSEEFSTRNDRRFEVGHEDSVITAFAAQHATTRGSHDFIVGTSRQEALLYLDQDPMQEPTPSISLPLNESATTVTAAAFAPDQKTMAVGTADNHLYVFRKGEGDPELIHHWVAPAAIQTISFANGDVLIATATALFILR